MGQLGGNIDLVSDAVFLENLTHSRLAAGVDIGGIIVVDAGIVGVHELLFRFAGKLQCYEYVVNMTIHMDRVRSMALKAQKTHPFVHQHEALLDAIRSRDEETASRLMSQHVSGYLVDRDALCQMYPQYVKTP
jgi:hypothetical protein